jgi:ribonuclease D
MIPPLLVTEPEVAVRIVDDIAAAHRVAIDTESNGMYVYDPQVCMVQAAWEDRAGTVQVAVFDTLAVSPALLAPVTSAASCIKVIHDLAFDARMLSRHGVALATVLDTSVSARYLGIVATGLASLLASELGIIVDKSLQTADWGKRPITPDALEYLTGDVRHLLALHDRLWERVVQAGIEDEVQTETAYKLACALNDPRAAPPWVRIRGAEGLDDTGRAVLRELAWAREELAAQRNVPLYKVVGDKQLVELAARRPMRPHGIRRVLSAGRGAHDEQITSMVQQAIIRGTAAGRLGDDDAAWLQVDRVDSETAQRRKRIDARLRAWRKAEAARRHVHEQVVLPTHCLERIVTHELRGPDSIAQIPGFGDARTRRYAQVLGGLVDDVLTGHA